MRDVARAPAPAAFCAACTGAAAVSTAAAVAAREASLACNTRLVEIGMPKTATTAINVPHTIQ